MPYAPRIAPGGTIFHVLNRGVRRMQLFATDSDYNDFVTLLGKAQKKMNMRICAYCIMPNHWHLVLWPEADGDLAKFMQWLCVTHAMRWQSFRQTIGYGHLYQGRYKSFPVHGDTYFYRVVRYVERNPLRANLVARAEQWRWSSLWQREYKSCEHAVKLCEWPDPIPQDWIMQVHTPLSHDELTAIQRCTIRGTPYGDATWRDTIAVQLGLQSTLRPRGRPKKET